MLIQNTESIVKAKGKSIIEILDQSESSNQDQESSARSRVISEALAVLLNIHHALCQEPGTPMSSSHLLRDSKSRRIVDGLLDLVSLEGIYPNLSPGVGIPIERRVKSVLQGGAMTRKSCTDDSQVAEGIGLLIKITESLNQIAANQEAVGLRQALYERTLVDLVASLGELAYNPSRTDSKFRSTYAAALKGLLDVYVDFLSHEILFSDLIA